MTKIPRLEASATGNCGRVSETGSREGGEAHGSGSRIEASGTRVRCGREGGSKRRELEFPSNPPGRIQSSRSRTHRNQYRP